MEVFWNPRDKRPMWLQKLCFQKDHQVEPQETGTANDRKWSSGPKYLGQEVGWPSSALEPSASPNACFGGRQEHDSMLCEGRGAAEGFGSWGCSQRAHWGAHGPQARAGLCVFVRGISALLKTGASASLPKQTTEPSASCFVSVV